MATKYTQSSRFAPRDDIVELKDTSLHIIDVVQGTGQVTHVFKWTIANYYRLLKRCSYASHHIRIGNTFHRLRIMKYDPKLPVGVLESRIIYLLIGLTPEPMTDVSVNFVILATKNFEVLPVNGLKNILRYIPYRECYVEFLDSMPTDSPHLVVLCKFVVVTKEYELSNTNFIDLEIVKPNRIFNDLGMMLKEGIFADIVIEVEEREFRTHRAILGARSSVFRSMFRNQMREKFDSRIVIEDIDSETFSEFLDYIYTGKTKCLTPDLAMELLPLSDKYDMQDLKLEVSDYLTCNLSIEHVLKAALLAELHNEDKLKYEATAFIANNLKSAMKMPDWSTFRHHVDLVEEVLKYLA